MDEVSLGTESYVTICWFSCTEQVTSNRKADLSKDYLFNHLGHEVLGRYKAERPPDGDLGKGMRLTPRRSSAGGEILRCIR